MKFGKKVAAALLLISATLQLSADRSNLINDLNKTLPKDDQIIFQRLISLQCRMWSLRAEIKVNDSLTHEQKIDLANEYLAIQKTIQHVMGSCSPASRQELVAAAIKLYRALVSQKIDMCEQIANELKKNN